MGIDLRVICVFAVCAILSVNCGVILEKLTNDLHKIQTDLDQQMKQFGEYFNQNLQQNQHWFQNGFNQPGQNSFGQPGYGGQGSFPGSGYGLNSGNGVFGRPGFGQGNFPESGNGFNTGIGVFGQPGVGQGSVPGYGNGLNSGNGAFGRPGFGQESFPESGSGLNSGNGVFGQPGVNQGSFPDSGSGLNSGNGVYGQPGIGQGSVPESGNGVVSKKPQIDQKSGTGSVVTSEGSNKLEIATQTSATASESSTKQEGRRIISAHSNCPPGYAADSRGRCREHF